MCHNIRMMQKQNDYHFISHWDIQAPLPELVGAVTNVYTWQGWWQGLQHITVLKQTENYVGSRFEAGWRSASGYVLTVEIVITGYKPRKLITFSSTGDLEGTGEWHFKAQGHKCSSAEIRWDVATTKPWMNNAAPVLRPLFRWNHALLMKRAERGLNEYLQR